MAPKLKMVVTLTTFSTNLLQLCSSTEKKDQEEHQPAHLIKMMMMK